MNAWAYVVVSSDKQAETLDFQRQWAETTARENGWRIERTFQDVSSGKLGVRRLLQTLIDELRSTPKAQRPKRILMVRLDRLGRGDALDVVASLAEIRKLGVTIHTREDGDVRIERASDAILPMLRSITSGLENEARSDKSRAGHAKRRQEGKHSGHAPYGIRLENGKPVPDGARAAVVQKVYAMRAEGAGYERIAHAVGPTAPPKMKVDGSTRKIGWHRTFVRTMLRVETYRGVVIDADLWDRVQLVKNPDFKERATKSFPWPLSGVVKCTCGYGLTGSASGGNCNRCSKGQRRHNHARIRYYLCNNPIAHPGKRPHLRADRLEEEFVALLQRLAATPSLIDDYRRTAVGDVEALRAQLREAEREAEALDGRRRAAFDLQASGVIPTDELAQRLAELRAERDTISESIASLKRTIAVATAQNTLQRDAQARLQRAAQTWSTIDPCRQKAIARTISVLVGGLRLGEDTHLQAGCNGSTGNICEQFSLSLAFQHIEQIASRLVPLDA